jgi:isopenicillin N synthase-like dioxygenase
MALRSMPRALDIEPLFGPAGPERDRLDAEIGEAAESTGLLAVAGASDLVPCDYQSRARLLSVFELPPEEQRRLWRHSYAPENVAIYRGWSPRGGEVLVDIYDIGPDVAYSHRVGEDDPLLGPTPLPPPELLPGWHELAADVYRRLECVGAVLMRSLARGLGLKESFFDDAFAGGNSTLRLMRYESKGDEGAARRREHVDSGFVTLLAQHGVAGLEARTRDGEWIAVPAFDDALVVNFGSLLERWTSGRVRATPHRVVSRERLRYSMPFFYEPPVDAVIRPLPLAAATPFEPFSYGDHLWEAIAAFPNFAGVADLRAPRGLGAGREA